MGKRYLFHGTILVPVPEIGRLTWVSTLNGDFNAVDVIILPAANPQELQKALEDDLKACQEKLTELKEDGQDVTNIEANIKFVSQTLECLKQGSPWVKTPEQPLIEALNESLRTANLRCEKMEKDDIVYISWVCGQI